MYICYLLTIPLGYDHQPHFANATNNDECCNQRYSGILPWAGALLVWGSEV